MNRNMLMNKIQNMTDMYCPMCCIIISRIGPYPKFEIRLSNNMCDTKTLNYNAASIFEIMFHI